MQKIIKVCLLWHNVNSENYGVSALAISHINMLLEVAKKMDLLREFSSVGTPNVGALSIKEEVEKKYLIRINHLNFSIKKTIISMFPFSRNYNTYMGYDVFFDIGEGDSFSDIYGFKRFFLLSISKLLPILSNKKLILSPQTYGPFKSRASKIISKYLIQRSKAVFSRDYKSTNILKSLSVKSTEVADIAFSLPYEKKATLQNSVGLNVSGLLWNGGYTSDNQFNLSLEYKELIKELIAGFSNKGKIVHLISHVISDTLPIDDDYRISEFIKNEYFLNDTNVIIAPRFSSPLTAKSYISSMDFFLGSRMHATIAAISSGVPTIPLAYSRKFEGVFGSIGYNHTLNLYNLEKEDCISNIFQSYETDKTKMQIDVVRAKDVAIASNNKYKEKLEVIFNEFN